MVSLFSVIQHSGCGMLNYQTKCLKTYEQTILQQDQICRADSKFTVVKKRIRMLDTFHWNSASWAPAWSDSIKRRTAPRSSHAFFLLGFCRRDVDGFKVLPVPVPILVPILFGSNSMVLFGSSVIFGSYIVVGTSGIKPIWLDPAQIQFRLESVWIQFWLESEPVWLSKLHQIQDV